MDRYRAIRTTLAALFFALIFVAGAEAAGKGVKLQFGYPLGSFVAHPSAKHAGKPSAAHSHKKARKSHKSATKKSKPSKKSTKNRKHLLAQKKAAAKKQKLAKQRAAEKKRKQQLAARNRAAAKRAADTKLAKRKTDPSLSRSSQRVVLNAADVPLPELAPFHQAALKIQPSDVGGIAGGAAPQQKAFARSNLVPLCDQYVPDAGLTIDVPCEN
ncbi:MAG: hypothetical protein AAFV69_05380 [Pseudomonadota bacterium]